MELQAHTHQLFFSFDHEPLGHTALREPPFQRAEKPSDPEDTFPSPREAFTKLVNPLLAKGYTEKEIHKPLFAFMQQERHFIAHLLILLEGGKAVDEEQQRNAIAFRKIMDQLTEFECAWHTFELDISPHASNPRLPISCRNTAKWFRGKLGKFRREMPKIYTELHKKR